MTHVNNLSKITDRTQDVKDITEKLMSEWDLHIEGRAADGLDMASLLYSLYRRSAYVTLPNYRASSVKSTVKTGTVVTSKENRNGPLHSLVSNKETLSFSIKIKDNNVVNLETGVGGEPHNFRIIDHDGSWYSGYAGLNFNPDTEELKVLSQITNHELALKNFIHPNRWVSLYGSPYITAKALMLRLNDRASFLKLDTRRILPFITFDTPPQKTAYESVEKGSVVKKKVESIEVKLDIPEFTGNYAPIESSIEGYDPEKDIAEYDNAKLLEVFKAASDERNVIIYSIIPQIQFLTRATEFAFYKYGRNGTEKFPAWVQNLSWERGVKFPRKRIEWNRLTLTDDTALRYRIVERTVNEKVENLVEGSIEK